MIKTGYALDYNKKKKAYVRPADSGTVMLITRYHARKFPHYDVDYDDWINILYFPHLKTFSKWKKSKQAEEDWKEYLDAFYPQRKEPEPAAEMNKLAQRVKNGESITLICACKPREHCHRYIIKSLIELL